mgnify:FL=1
MNQKTMRVLGLVADIIEGVVPLIRGISRGQAPRVSEIIGPLGEKLTDRAALHRAEEAYRDKFGGDSAD